MSLNSTVNGPSQTQLRAELEQMVIGDLLGPSGGESEELTERSVRVRYLVGVLAPSRGGDSSGQDDRHVTQPQAQSPAGTQGTAGGDDDDNALGCDTVPGECSVDGQAKG